MIMLARAISTLPDPTSRLMNNDLEGIWEGICDVIDVVFGCLHREAWHKTP
jgi:hypothetical protein